MWNRLPVSTVGISDYTCHRPRHSIEADAASRPMSVAPSSVASVPTTGRGDRCRTELRARCNRVAYSQSSSSSTAIIARGSLCCPPCSNSFSLAVPMKNIALSPPVATRIDQFRFICNTLLDLPTPSPIPAQSGFCFNQRAIASPISRPASSCT